jgi:hypothetical protein
MRVDRRLLLALALSLMAHVLTISAPVWRLPFSDKPEANDRLEARLMPKPMPPRATQPPQPPQPPPKKKPAPRKQLPSLPASGQSTPTLAVASPSEAETAPASSSAAEAAPAATETAAITWPRDGRIRFDVTRGEGERSMLIGETTHTWHHDGEHYRLQVVAKTTGLVSLFVRENFVQTSEGAISAEGLIPSDFTVERKGRLEEGAHFDWNAGKVALLRGGQLRREVPLVAGAQDLLSQAYQMGLAGAAARVDMMIVTGKNAGNYAYEAAGDETLATRFGELRVWHVKTLAITGEQTIELWLAQDYGNLPLRIRFIDRDGMVYDQNAVELEIDGAALSPLPEEMGRGPARND